jgi:hypothetical protein
MLPAILAGASLIGKLFGGASKGRAEGRAAETQVLQQQDQTALQRFLAAQNAQNTAAQTDLQRKQYSLQAPGQRAQNSTRGDILATLQKPTAAQQAHPRANVIDFLQGAPELSANTRALGTKMSQQALDSQDAGDTFTGGNLLLVPQASPLPQAGKLDKFLNVGSTIGGLAGGAGMLWDDLNSQQPTVAGQQANAVPPSYLDQMFKKVKFG